MLFLQWHYRTRQRMYSQLKFALISLIKNYNFSFGSNSVEIDWPFRLCSLVFLFFWFTKCWHLDANTFQIHDNRLCPLPNGPPNSLPCTCHTMWISSNHWAVRARLAFDKQMLQSIHHRRQIWILCRWVQWPIWIVVRTQMGSRQIVPPHHIC